MLKKFAGGFFVVLLLLTWFSWKLDELRTPQVICVSPGVGQLPDEDGRLQSYSSVLPLAAVHQAGDSCTVYLVEETNSFFSPLVAKSVSISVQAQTESQAAVSGLGDAQVILYASRPLIGETVAVKLWETEQAAGRVEVTCTQGAEVLEQALAQTDPAWTIHREGERLVISDADLFTARQLETVLVQAGLSLDTVTIRDYAWADDLLKQGRTLWRLAGVLALTWFFVRCVRSVVQREYRRGVHALQSCYLSAYIGENSVRLLAEIVFLAAGSLICLVLLAWMWQVKLVLPTGFLPDASIFDWEHYRVWWAAAFPADTRSDFGRQLAAMLRKTYLLAGGASAFLLLAAGLVPIKI